MPGGSISVDKRARPQIVLALARIRGPPRATPLACDGRQHLNTSRVEIDLSAIDHNLGVLRDCARAGARAQGVPDDAVKLCAVIKQDAYGLGAARIAKRLASSVAGDAARGADMLAVYCLSEARALVDVPITTPILVLMPAGGFDRNDQLYRLAVRSRLHFVVHSLAHAQVLSDLAAKLGLVLPVHVQVDVGMSRGGCLPDEALRLLDLVVHSQRLSLAGLMTHFSAPGSDAAFTRQQSHLFRAWIDSAKTILTEHAKSLRLRGGTPAIVHLANTCATLRSPGLHGTMVRVGQGLLGYGPEAFSEDDPHDTPEFADAAKALRPCVRWVSRVVHTHTIPAGWPVGYDRTFVAQRPSVVGVVPVGYADGYPRALGNRAYVRLTGLAWDRPRTVGPLESSQPANHAARDASGLFAPVIGRVSMDQITIDLTDVPEAFRAIGAEVELVGTNTEAPNHLPLLAALGQTITHEMLCRISPHLERLYVSSQAPASDEEHDDISIQLAQRVARLMDAGQPVARVSPAASPANTSPTETPARKLSKTPA